MFERYTEASRRAIFFAREEAMQRGAIEIATSDLFLGIVREPAENESIIAPLHARASELRELFASKTDPGSNHKKSNLPLSNSSKRALAYGAQEADRKKLWPITRDLLLRGILRTRDETAAILNMAGIGLDTLKSIVPSEKSSGLPVTRRRASYHLRQLLLRRYWLLVVGMLVAAAVLYLHFQN